MSTVRALLAVILFIGVFGLEGLSLAESVSRDIVLNPSKTMECSGFAHSGDDSTKVARETKEVTVYVTRTGKKYHRAGCRYLKKGCIPLTLKDAKIRGYGACKVCRPPLK